jgi:RepB DNA-primase from phage plasmid
MDRGFFITLQTVRRQLAAMPSDLYQLRLIHHHTRKAVPLQTVWTAPQLAHPAFIRLLRFHNAQGSDVYLRPYAGPQNAGYILLDLDAAAPDTLERMRAHGHEPCVVLQTSPGHLQTWLRLSPTPLESALATALGRHLAHFYHGDPASADWCHLGRLAGFTNQKPARRQLSGYAPWVRLLRAQPPGATHAHSLLQQAAGGLVSAPNSNQDAVRSPSAPADIAARTANLTPTAAAAIYHRFLDRLRIPQRFPQPDWSIADFWIAQALFRCRVPASQIHTILRFGSPGFPRCHSQPEDYLARTLQRAARACERAPIRFLARPPRAPGVILATHP